MRLNGPVWSLLSQNSLNSVNRQYGARTSASSSSLRLLLASSGCCGHWIKPAAGTGLNLPLPSLLKLVLPVMVMLTLLLPRMLLPLLLSYLFRLQLPPSSRLLSCCLVWRLP
jgi:hypothetical protein